MSSILKYKKLALICILPFVFTSCAFLKEAGKKVWGSSTQALEKRKGQGRVKFLQCSFSDCFNACLETLEEMEAVVFQKSRRRGFIVAMNFEGAVDTTEVGIFFESTATHLTSIEIISLNHRLQEAAASDIFSRLQKKFFKIDK